MSSCEPSTCCTTALVSTLATGGSGTCSRARGAASWSRRCRAGRSPSTASASRPIPTAASSPPRCCSSRANGARRTRTLSRFRIGARRRSRLAGARGTGTIGCPAIASLAMRAALLPIALLAAAATSCAAQEVNVRVERNGETVVVDVDAQMPGTLRETWAVFTDYENMASFITNLTASRVVARKDHTLEVMQAGSTKVGFMTFGFEAVRAVELLPMHEIRSSLVSGDFKSYASTTSLAAAASGTRVRHHGEYVPKSWLPPLVGPAVIERETKKQYQEFAAGIARRSAPRH